MIKVAISKINEALEDNPELFICNASYESRCLSIARRIDTSKLRHAFVLRNTDFEAEIRLQERALVKTFGEKTITISLDTDHQLESADRLRRNVIPAIKDCTGLCLIDITTFTHEHLLILIRLIYELTPRTQVRLAYTGADAYSTNTTENNAWLSKGVFDIRSVLGYSGKMFPSRRLHLVVLVGFEVERAEILVSYYEPSLVSLGSVRKGQSVKEKFTDANKRYHRKITAFIKRMVTSYDIVSEFEFSAIDPLVTMNDILAEAERNPDFNTVVCTMNTKLSTIGAALAAIKSEDIQLVYAQPAQYNTRGYSRAGKSVRIVSLNEIFDKSGVSS